MESLLDALRKMIAPPDLKPDGRGLAPGEAQNNYQPQKQYPEKPVQHEQRDSDFYNENKHLFPDDPKDHLQGLLKDADEAFPDDEFDEVIEELMHDPPKATDTLDYHNDTNNNKWNTPLNYDMEETGPENIKELLLRNTLAQQFQNAFKQKYGRDLDNQEMGKLWGKMDNQMKSYGMGKLDDFIGKQLDTDGLHDERDI